MADAKKPTDPTKQDEARSLAQEAVEEMKEGHKDETSFLAEEAKALDPQAAKEVLKDVPQRKKA